MTRFAGSDSAMASLFGGMKTPEYDKLANLGIEARGQTEQTAMKADATARKAQKEAQGLVDQAEFAGAATKAQAAAQSQSSMMSGLMGGIGSIASAGIGSMGSTGGAMPSSYGASTFGSGYASQGNKYAGAFAPGNGLSTFGMKF